MTHEPWSKGSPAPGEAGWAAVHVPRRVQWMELFFDLVFVAFVGQLAHGIHGNPGWAEFGTFVLLFFPAWWAWVNIVSVVNLLPGLSPRALGLAMVAAMAAAGLMAAAAPGAFGDRAWAFSLANAAMRVVLLVLWLYQHRGNSEGTPWRILVYNGGTALLWTAAAFLPLQLAAVLWGTSIVAEVCMVVLGGRLWANRSVGGIDIEHAAERLGLFVIIVLGESVFVVVTEVSDHWSPDAGMAGALGFLVVAFLGWAFFQYGTSAMTEGLAGLRGRADFSGILQTTLFYPFLLVVGVTSIAGAIATAVAEPSDPLPGGAGIALGAGLALFYGCNAIVSLRYGRAPRAVLPWAAPAVALALALIPATAVVSAAVSLLFTVVLLAGITAYVEVSRALSR